MIDMLDVNHDNRISIDEFRRFVYLLPESLVRVPHTGWHASGERRMGPVQKPCTHRDYLVPRAAKYKSRPCVVLKASGWQSLISGALSRSRPPTSFLLLWTAATGCRAWSSDCEHTEHLPALICTATLPSQFVIQKLLGIGTAVLVVCLVHLPSKKAALGEISNDDDSLMLTTQVHDSPQAAFSTVR